MRFFLIIQIIIAFAYAKEYKVIFDCSSADMHYLKSRMWLIGKTMQMFENNNDHIDVVLTMHGKCTALASEDIDMVVDEEDVKVATIAQKYLKELLQKDNFQAYVCAMSIDTNGIEKESILSNITISPNSFIETIKYQNSGYAIMSFK